MTVQKLFIAIAIISILIAFYKRQKSQSNLLIGFLQSFMGILFVFSGLVKAIDPKGTAFKMKEYFESFAQDGMRGLWEGMSDYSLLFASAMIIFEIVLGVAIFFGWKKKWAAIGVLGINLFFLFLTGYTYLSGFCITKQVVVVVLLLMLFLFSVSFIQNNKKRNMGLSLFSGLLVLYFLYCKFSGNCTTCDFTEAKMKVKDCGCFGDFMKLKPWETFYKDIFLTGVSLILVRNYEKITQWFSAKRGGIVVLVGLVIAILFSLYNTVMNEPIVDFRPYAIGNNINEKMKEIKPSIVENILIYKNKQTGKMSRFTIDNIPTDTLWEYSDRIDSVIEEGIPAPIHNLIFEDMEGNNVTYSLLNEPTISYWIIVYNADKANMDFLSQTAVPFAQEMRKKGINVYCLIGKSSAELEKNIGDNMDKVIADETALKTMTRSNPGVMKIQNGVVLDKWHFKQFNSTKAGI